MTDKTEAQPEALRLANNRPQSIDDDLYAWSLSAEYAIREQHVEIDRLRALAATCYAGLGGECDLPVIWLDALNDAANGEPFDADGLLPYTSAIRAQLVAQTNRAAAAEQQVLALTKRLDMANAMGNDARNQLAQLSARQAAPDGRLRTALERIIGWNRDHANELCGDPDRAEGWACVREARAALTAAPPPPEREPLSDDQWQALADALDGIINRELKDKISTILQLPTE